MGLCLATRLANAPGEIGRPLTAMRSLTVRKWGLQGHEFVE
jgi:hypothetical protein